MQELLIFARQKVNINDGLWEELYNSLAVRVSASLACLDVPAHFLC
jgi:hypothetical protein